MRHSSHGLRIALLAGASVVALTAAAPSAGAADLNKKPMPMKAPPALPVAKETWTWWIEGGAFNPGGDTFSLGAQVSNIKPRWGWEGAAGFDWQPGWGPWHLSGQFRYGSAQKTQAFHAGIGGGHSTTVITPGGGTTLVTTASNNEKIRDDHWLVDFAVGRDFGLGSGTAQWKLGLRVADLRAKLTASGSLNTGAGTVAFSTRQDATFVGAGPRLGVEGSTPLGGGWSIDWLAGAALLVGERHSSQTSVIPIGGVVTFPGQASSDTPVVFNVDGQAGLSYWFSPTFKITASYRVDAYFNALKTIKPGTSTFSSNVDQIYNGPMLRLTSSF